jgi:hypothetical protein
MTAEQTTSSRSPRSFAAFRTQHLRRLVNLANADHEFFTRPDWRPEYQSRRLAVGLAQGAALHYLDGKNGVKDFDIWTFYAGLPRVSGPRKLGMGGRQSPPQRTRWLRLAGHVTHGMLGRDDSTTSDSPSWDACPNQTSATVRRPSSGASASG